MDKEDRQTPEKIELGISYFDRIEQLECGYFNSMVIISYN